MNALEWLGLLDNLCDPESRGHGSMQQRLMLRMQSKGQMMCSGELANGRSTAPRAAGRAKLLPGQQVLCSGVGGAIKSDV